MTRPAVGLLAGVVGVWSFLRWDDVVGEWIPTTLQSGCYNSILFVAGGSFGLLIYRILRLGDPPGPSLEDGFSVTAGGTVRVLSVIAASIVWINVLDYVLKRFVEYEYRRVMPFFAVETEGNLPTFFSAMLLLLCAALLALVSRVGRRGRRDRLAWFSLAAVFTFLALDEIAVIHEKLVPLGRSLVSESRAVGREWLFIYVALMVPIGLFYLPFLSRLPSVTRRLWIAAGTVFLSGAVGLEFLSGWYGLKPGGSPLGFAVNLAEESLEMIGVLLFLYGLLDYMEKEIGRIGILSRERDTGVR